MVWYTKNIKKRSKVLKVIDKAMKRINILKSSDDKLAYNQLKELLILSDKSYELYVFFDEFVEMMNNTSNSYIRTRGLRLIAYNSKWDKENKVNAIILEYLKHIEDDKPITSRQCIKDTVIIAKNKPELITVIIDALERITKIYEPSMQSLIYKDRQKAIRQIKELMWED